jgi:hypothetical protein
MSSVSAEVHQSLIVNFSKISDASRDQFKIFPNLDGKVAFEAHGKD